MWTGLSAKPFTILELRDSNHRLFLLLRGLKRDILTVGTPHQYPCNVLLVSSFVNWNEPPRGKRKGAIARIDLFSGVSIYNKVQRPLM